MKTITIKQPWAHLVCTPRKDNPQLGIKDIENRTWPTKFRGRVLVHASAKIVTPSPLGFVQWNSLTPDQKLSLRVNKLDVSAIIGSVEIVDCVQNHESIWAEHKAFKKVVKYGIESIIEVPVHNLVLANPVLFAKPIPAKGKLNFWDFLMTEEEYFNLEKIGNQRK